MLLHGSTPGGMAYLLFGLQHLDKQVHHKVIPQNGLEGRNLREPSPGHEQVRAKMGPEGQATEPRGHLEPQGSIRQLQWLWRNHKCLADAAVDVGPNALVGD
jgi:hypothetical protein